MKTHLKLKQVGRKQKAGKASPEFELTKQRELLIDAAWTSILLL
jgi:hypothetical protein